MYLIPVHHRTQFEAIIAAETRRIETCLADTLQRSVLAASKIDALVRSYLGETFDLALAAPSTMGACTSSMSSSRNRSWVGQPLSASQPCSA